MELFSANFSHSTSSSTTVGVMEYSRSCCGSETMSGASSVSVGASSLGCSVWSTRVSSSKVSAPELSEHKSGNVSEKTHRPERFNIDKSNLSGKLEALIDCMHSFRAKSRNSQHSIRNSAYTRGPHKLVRYGGPKIPYLKVKYAST